MRATAGMMELWRRIALALGILMGLALFFYVEPAMISVTAVDWEREQADELETYNRFIPEEDEQFKAVPLDEYIRDKAAGKVITALGSEEWANFFAQVRLASNGEYGSSEYGERVSAEDKDDFWKPTGAVSVFFKPDELPYAQWGLREQDGDTAYICTNNGSEAVYLQVKYQDYLTSVGVMSSPYRTAPGWLYHPYRTAGIVFMIMGLLLYIFLPRRKKQDNDISYGGGNMLAGDIVGLVLLTPFYGLPFLINGGTVQAISGWWPLTLVMWLIGSISLYLLYTNAWNASYRIELTPDALYLITFKGVQELRFSELAAVDLVALRNPGWFRKLFLLMALFSVNSGQGSSVRMAGTALLTATASYGGLEFRRRGGGKPVYIWFSDQLEHVIINNFDRVPEAIAAAGVPFNTELREIEGFSMFM